jgi:hypothetical protein
VLNFADKPPLDFSATTRKEDLSIYSQLHSGYVLGLLLKTGFGRLVADRGNLQRTIGNGTLAGMGRRFESYREFMGNYQGQTETEFRAAKNS